MEWLEATARRLEFLKRQRAPSVSSDEENQSVSVEKTKADSNLIDAQVPEEASAGSSRSVMLKERPVWKLDASAGASAASAPGSAALLEDQEASNPEKLKIDKLAEEMRRRLMRKKKKMESERLKKQRLTPQETKVQSGASTNSAVGALRTSYDKQLASVPVVLKERSPCMDAWSAASADSSMSSQPQEAAPGGQQEASNYTASAPVSSKASQSELPASSQTPQDSPSTCPKCSYTQKLRDKMSAMTHNFAVKVVQLNRNMSQLKKSLAEEQAKHQLAEQRCESLQGQLTSSLEELAQLKAQLQVQKSVTGLSHGACWQFEMQGGWEAFAPEANEKMHRAYLEYLKGVSNSRYSTITSGGVARAVDFELMQQKHLHTQKVRQIRILPGAPPAWSSSPAHLLQQGHELGSFYKEVQDQNIWDSIRNILQNTGHAGDATQDCSCMKQAEIKSVHRIENLRLWHRYKARLAGMRQDHATYSISVDCAELDLDGKSKVMTDAQKTFDCDDALALDVDEKILLHGTSWHNANSIVREGFDHRACQHAFYGAGVYFASSACKSHQYTCEQHKWCCGCHGERTLIISRVALGDSYTAAETRLKERRPPVRPASAGTYDSIVVKPGPIQGHHNWNQFHQEFVIFDREQAYPCYVVQYSI